MSMHANPSSKSFTQPDGSRYSPKDGRGTQAQNDHPIYLFRFKTLPPAGFEYIHPLIHDLIGWTPYELYDDPTRGAGIIHPLDRENISILSKGQARNILDLTRLMHKNGSEIHIDLQIRPVFNALDEVMAIEGYAGGNLHAQENFQMGHPNLTADNMEEMNRWLGADFSLTETLPRMILSLEKRVDYDVCQILVKEEKNELLVALNRTHAEPGPTKLELAAIMNSSLALRVFLDKRVPHSLHLNDSKTQIAGLPLAKEILIYPINCLGEVWGAFCLVRWSGRAFSQAEMANARYYLGLANLAIEKMHLVAQVKTYEQLIDRLSPISVSVERPTKVAEVTQLIGQGALSVSGADRVAVYGHDSKQNITHLWSQGLSSEGLGRLLALALDSDSHTSENAKVLNLTSNVSELPTGSSLRQMAEAEGIHALANCPVVLENSQRANIDYFYNLPHSWTNSEQEALMVYAHQAAIVLENTRLNEEIEEVYLETVLTLAKALDVRDSYTAYHSWRLAAWAESTARRLGCSQDQIQLIRWAALLHDVGKIGVPDAILHKAGPLNEEEWRVMKRHPELGADIVSPMKKLNNVTRIIRAHQERYDGTGYPDGLAGDEIPLAARILTVVDAYGAMTDDRVFRPARSQAEAVAELKRCSGKQFDQQVVDVFFQVINANAMVN